MQFIPVLASWILYGHTVTLLLSFDEFSMSLMNERMNFFQKKKKIILAPNF